MTTIHFLCGMGVGALLTTVFFLILIVILFRYMGRTRTEQQAKADQQHADLMQLHTERNAMVHDALDAVLQIKDVFDRYTPPRNKARPRPSRGIH